jgi:hypothetical protein
MPAIPFCGETYSDKTLNANAQRAINWYPFVSPTPQNPKRQIMYPTPNFYQAISQSFTQSRGLINVNNNIFFVAGNGFYQFTPNNPQDPLLTQGSITKLGTLNTSFGICSIVCNTVQIVISDSTYGYVYNLTSGAFTQISTSGGFPANGVTNLTYQDSFVIAAVNDSQELIISNSLDATTWNALSVDKIYSYSDNISGVFSDGLQLYVMGPKFTEVQYDAGTYPYPFSRVQGVLIKAGLAAVNSLCLVGNTVAFLASDIAGKAYVAFLNGYSTEPISTAPINEKLERYSTVSDAFAYTYREGDNQFYVITFPTAQATWACDIKTKQWHERQYNGGADLPSFYITWNGLHVVMDSTGNFYLMSQDYPPTGEVFLSVTIPSPRVRTCQHFMNDGKTSFIEELHAEMECGLLDAQIQQYGIDIANYGNNGNDNPPQVTLEISRDGGHVWHNVGMRSLGKMGQYLTRVIWRKLGRFRTYATFRVTITDPCRPYLLGAWATIKGGLK